MEPVEAEAVTDDGEDVGDAVGALSAFGCELGDVERVGEEVERGDACRELGRNAPRLEVGGRTDRCAPVRRRGRTEAS